MDFIIGLPRTSSDKNTTLIWYSFSLIDRYRLLQRTIQTLQDMLISYIIEVYGRKGKNPICWDDVGEKRLTSRVYITIRRKSEVGWRVSHNGIEL